MAVPSDLDPVAGRDIESVGEAVVRADAEQQRANTAEERADFERHRADRERQARLEAEAELARLRALVKDEER